MTAATDSIMPTVTAKPDPSSSILDAVLAGPLVAMTGGTNAVTVANDDHPLLGLDSVEDAMPVIANLMAAEAKGANRRVYPRSQLRHQHIVAFMLVNPFATTPEICAFFGISPTTLHNISKSDTFKALVGQHRVSVENIGADIQDQLRQALSASIEVVGKAVVERQDPDYALAVMDKAANRLGLGAKHNTNVQINNNIVTPEMIAAARARRLPSAS